MTQNVQTSGSAATNFGIVAWITYGVLSANGHWIGAALGALVVALAIVAHEYKCNAVKIMNCTTVAFFGFALVTTIAVGPALFKSDNIWLTWAVFAVVTWVTLLIGFPFTIQYAREQAPREVWDHPQFHRLNVILTIIFGLIFTANTGLGLYALKTGYLLSFGLIVPISLLIAGLAFSAQYPKRYSRRFAPDWAAAQAGKLA